MMNPMYQKLLASLIRQAMKTAGVTGAIVADDEIVKAISGAIAVVGFLMGLYKEYKDQQKLVTAAATPYPVSVDQVKELVKSGLAPSVTTPNATIPATQ